MFGRLIQDKVAHDGTMQRFITKRTARVYTNQFIQRLLQEHGFTIEEVYGSNDFQPFDPASSERAIIVAQVP
jgi:hypothetical protein